MYQLTLTQSINSENTTFNFNSSALIINE